MGPWVQVGYRVLKEGGGFEWAGGYTWVGGFKMGVVSSRDQLGGSEFRLVGSGGLKGSEGVLVNSECGLAGS